MRITRLSSRRGNIAEAGALSLGSVRVTIRRNNTHRENAGKHRIVAIHNSRFEERATILPVRRLIVLHTRETRALL